jgi:hypothetical protein
MRKSDRLSGVLRHYKCRPRGRRPAAVAIGLTEASAERAAAALVLVAAAEVRLRVFAALGDQPRSNRGTTATAVITTSEMPLPLQSPPRSSNYREIFRRLKLSIATRASKGPNGTSCLSRSAHDLGRTDRREQLRSLGRRQAGSTRRRRHRAKRARAANHSRCQPAGRPKHGNKPRPAVGYQRRVEQI